jgi:hypothetical protein
LRKISKPDPGDIGSDEVAIIHSDRLRRIAGICFIPAPHCIFFE